MDLDFASEPSLTTGQRAGQLGPALFSNRKVLGEYVSGVVTVTTHTATSDKATVQRFVDAIVKAERYLAGHPDRAVAVAHEEFPTVNVDVLTAAIGHMEDEGVWSTDGKFGDAGVRTAAGIAAATASLDATKIDAKASIITSFVDHAPH